MLVLLVGLAGRVVDETKRTLAVADAAPRAAERASGSSPRADSGAGVRQVPKAAATFEFRLSGTDDDASARGAQEADQFVTVAGERLVARPARRTEHRGDSIWR